mgnify:CR=1 FL=1
MLQSEKAEKSMSIIRRLLVKYYLQVSALDPEIQKIIQGLEIVLALGGVLHQRGLLGQDVLQRRLVARGLGLVLGGHVLQAERRHCRALVGQHRDQPFAGQSEQRLANRLARRRAWRYLSLADEWFAPPGAGEEAAP